MHGAELRQVLPPELRARPPVRCRCLENRCHCRRRTHAAHRSFTRFKHSSTFLCPRHLCHTCNGRRCVMAAAAVAGAVAGRFACRGPVTAPLSSCTTALLIRAAPGQGECWHAALLPVHGCLPPALPAARLRHAWGPHLLPCAYPGAASLPASLRPPPLTFSHCRDPQFARLEANDQPAEDRFVAAGTGGILLKWGSFLIPNIDIPATWCAALRCRCAERRRPPPSLPSPPSPPSVTASRAQSRSGLAAHPPPALSD